MAIDKIQVRKKINHALTRSIKLSALSTFQKRGWEPVNATVSVQTTAEVKKKDVEPAEVPGKVEQTSEPEPQTPFAPVGDEPEENALDSLREKYQSITGKAADKRWSEKRLNEEIAKLAE